MGGHGVFSPTYRLLIYTEQLIGCCQLNSVKASPVGMPGSYYCGPFLMLYRCFLGLQKQHYVDKNSLKNLVRC